MQANAGTAFAAPAVRAGPSPTPAQSRHRAGGSANALPSPPSQKAAKEMLNPEGSTHHPLPTLRRGHRHTKHLPISRCQVRYQHLIPPWDAALGLSLPELQVRELSDTTKGAASLPVSQRTAQQGGRRSLRKRRQRCCSAVLREGGRQGGIFPAKAVLGGPRSPESRGFSESWPSRVCNRSLLAAGSSDPLPDPWSCNTGTSDTNQELRKPKLKRSGVRVPPAHHPA